MAEFKRTTYPVLGRSLGRGKLYRIYLFFDSILAGADQTGMISQPLCVQDTTFKVFLIFTAFWSSCQGKTTERYSSGQIDGMKK